VLTQEPGDEFTRDIFHHTFRIIPASAALDNVKVMEV